MVGLKDQSSIPELKLTFLPICLNFSILKGLIFHLMFDAKMLKDELVP